MLQLQKIGLSPELAIPADTTKNAPAWPGTNYLKVFA